MTGEMIAQSKAARKIESKDEIQNILWLFNLKINDKMKVHFYKIYCQDNLL